MSGLLLCTSCSGGDDGDEPTPAPTPTPSPTPSTDNDDDDSGNDPNKDPDPTPTVGEKATFSFTGSLNTMSRATETSFEKGDMISIYAVKKSNGLTLKSSGNYADNVKYTYDGSIFTSTTPVTIGKDSVDFLAFYAVYPYSLSAGANMTFTALSNQTTASNLTASDFSTAYVSPSTSIKPELKFDHRMANIRVQLSGDLGSSISVSLTNVYSSVAANINDNTFTSTGGKSEIKMYSRGNGLYEAFAAPQEIIANANFITVTMDGESHKLCLDSNRTFKSGTVTTLTFNFTKEKTFVYVNGDIHEWYY